jgi:pSer/pThr/pTyr-binding forkhead associated (FHA) protein
MSNEQNPATQLSEKQKNISSSFLSSRGVLLVLSSNFLGKTFIIDKPKNIIGRQDTCDFLINDPLISKEHCVIILDEEGKFFIEDLHSKNATYVNGKAIKKRTQIFYSDKIVTGSTIIRFYHEEKQVKK